MVNRQDAPCSPASPEIGRGAVPAEIISDGTKLPLERSRPKTTTDGMNCSFSAVIDQAESGPSQLDLRRAAAMRPPIRTDGLPVRGSSQGERFVLPSRAGGETAQSISRAPRTLLAGLHRQSF